MASNAKIGLLLGLAVIFVIAFLLNGLHSFVNVGGSDDLPKIVIIDKPDIPPEDFPPGRVPERHPEETPPPEDKGNFRGQPPGTTSPDEADNYTEPAKQAWPKVHIVCKGDNLADIAKKIPFVFPVHPRTMKNLETYGYLSLLNGSSNLRLMEPLSYLSFMNLVFNCRLVITDSGGIQEETTYLGIPCLTLRENTERPVTITQGTNQLCNVNNLVENVNDIIDGSCSKRIVPDLWDGHTAGRVVQSTKGFLKA